jgi:hypothetical protein
MPEKMRTVMLLEEADWRGKERYMNGSKVTDTFSHTGHTSVDLNCP